jgi:peptide deformylase
MISAGLHASRPSADTVDYRAARPSWILEQTETVAIRRVLRMGHPTLRRVARPVAPSELGTPWLHGLVKDMVDTLHDYGGVGLAAPQVGESLRLAVIEIGGGKSRYGEIPALPLTVFVNPTVEVLDAATAGYWEGCLSIPGLRGFVERPQRVRIDYTTLGGDSAELTLSGFLATVFQHEFDHLDGRLYIDRIQDPRLLGFDEEFERFLAPKDAA